MGCFKLDCDTCYSATYFVGPQGIVVPSTFPMSSPSYYLWLENSFGTIYSVLTAINGDGTFYINPDNYPQGMFVPGNGNFTIWMTTDVVGNNLIMIPMGVSPELFCISFCVGGCFDGGFSGYSGNQVCCPVTESTNPFCGMSGYSGYSGLGGSGVSGYSGSNGVSGYSGVNGSDGASGYSGVSGFSGGGGKGGGPFVEQATLNILPIAPFGDTIGAGVSGSSIGGGTGHSISTVYSNISGGIGNKIEGTVYASSYSTIGGGKNNTIAYGNSSTIGGGKGNSVSGVTAVTIGGGNNNKAYSQYATVGGGAANKNYSLAATIGGGFANKIGYQSYTSTESTIGGGNSNAIKGQLNTIGGGQSNRIYGNAKFGSIGGGKRNEIYGTANYSSIIGGQYNYNSNWANAHIIGSHINATQANTTFVEALSINSATTPVLLPTSDGTAGQVIQTNGAGIARWTGAIVLLNKTTGVDLNTPFQSPPADVTITLTGGTTFVITDILITNASATPTTVEDLEWWSGTGRTGNQFAQAPYSPSNSMTYLVSPTNYLSLNSELTYGLGLIQSSAGGSTPVISTNTLYFSLALPEGSPLTCDMYIYGYIIN